jgi:hypothetical protein
MPYSDVIAERRMAMTRSFCFTLLTSLAVAVLATAPAPADPDTTREGAYHLEVIRAAGAPAQDLLYVNDHGSWNIGPGRSVGQANFLWRGDPGRKSTDLLDYVGRGTLVDRDADRAYHGWVYKAIGHWGHPTYWFFSESPLPGPVDGDPVYPLFYSTGPTPREWRYHRYLTAGGTRRH